jgi:hypothetical protein
VNSIRPKDFKEPAMDILIAVLGLLTVIVAAVIAFVYIRSRQRSGSVLATPDAGQQPDSSS